MSSPEAGRPLIHERDIDAVAVLALLEDMRIGQKYNLTGPATLTQTEYGDTERWLDPLAGWDITVGNGHEVDYPMPWVGHADLIRSAVMRAAIEATGSTGRHWTDRIEQSGNKENLLCA